MAHSTDIAVKDKKTKRNWIYAKKVTGPLFTYRQYIGYLLLCLLIITPFTKIGGEPLLLFNVIERRFVVFGMVFYPQDLHIFVFGMLIAMVCIVLFTVVYGRVWCGWACPQTIFMELVFRRIEYWIEGDAHQQQHLAQQPLDGRKMLKKVIKHGVFLVISFFIANIFLAYIIGVQSLINIITDPINQHISGLIAISIFTLVFYAVFAYARELVCTTICPYGRLQGVLLDEQSITVAYNHKRGEPRGKRKRGQTEPQQGDCVDCGLCVQVCPTGIDIRNGIQLECVNCTACIDACDAVMQKIGRPTRLIGFYSTKDIEEVGSKRNYTRTIAYSAVLLVLLITCGWLIFSRSILDGTLLRANGTSYIFRDDGTVTNLYNLELINKSPNTLPFALESANGDFRLQTVGNIREIKKDETVHLSFFLVIPKNKIHHYKTDVKVKIVSANKVVKQMKTTFVAPVGG
ncbi:cytochrome c oxidase accessory protein CcoG [Olivibacter ginsenosidimutans]|uniref:Cytochrome c oxidase accessory protein CcoG n=1 Tax=Olivibacter ginsenosidimutans TaxID=1176537 RepID=A0ABP9BIW9_9SPHI